MLEGCTSSMKTRVLLPAAEHPVSQLAASKTKHLPGIYKPAEYSEPCTLSVPSCEIVSN